MKAYVCTVVNFSITWSPALIITLEFNQGTQRLLFINNRHSFKNVFKWEVKYNFFSSSSWFSWLVIKIISSNFLICTDVHILICVSTESLNVLPKQNQQSSFYLRRRGTYFVRFVLILINWNWWFSFNLTLSNCTSFLYLLLVYSYDL